MQNDEFKARLNLIGKGHAAAPLDFLGKFNKGLEEDNPDIHRSLQALTRLAEPSVQVICLHVSPDGVFLHENDHNPVNMDQVAQGKSVSDLLRRSMPITDRRVVFNLLSQEPPAVWKKCPGLRHHRLLNFENGVARVDRYLLRLDEELGLCINEPQNEGESEE